MKILIKNNNINTYQNTSIKMSVCYYKRYTNNLSIRSIENYRYIDLKLTRFNFDININKLSDIIYKILSDYCKSKVIGYDKDTHKYWCKIYDKDYCTLHIEIEMFKYNDVKSFVNIIPLTGSDTIINEFTSNFKETIQLYKTSSFIRACLEGHSGL